MDKPAQTNENITDGTIEKNETARLTGAAWVDKPVKVDGMTTAEEFTNKADSTAD